VAILFNNVGAAVAGGAAVTLLTVPAGAEAMALELKFTPVGGTANLTLTLERQATGVPFNFVTGHAIAAGDIFDFGKIALQEGDILSFSATGNDLNGLVSYYQDGAATTSAGSLNPRGEYSAPATYNRLDVVSYGGISYIQLNDGITGDAPPSVNWMINAAPTTHTHPIGEVAGLQTALDGKSATGHGHGIADVTGLQDALGNKMDRKWITKDTAYSALVGDRILADTSGAAFAVTLPATPTNGDEIWFADPGSNWAANALTVNGNGKNIDDAATFAGDLNGGYFTLIYNGTAWSVRNSGGQA
jgi:hypothetical protein